MSRFTDFAKQTFFSANNRTQGTVSKSTAYIGKNDYDCPLVFMHVPKCGGMSLVNSLIDAIGPSSVLSGFDLTLFGDFVDFHSLDPTIRHAIYINHLPEGAFDFYQRHMALSTLERRFPNARRMTLLRHPTVRLISLYLYWRSLRDQELQRWGSWAERVRLSNDRLLDFRGPTPRASPIKAKPWRLSSLKSTEKCCERYTRSLRPHYMRSTVALDSIERNSEYSVSIGQ
jgi:hypothetical protein